MPSLVSALVGSDVSSLVRTALAALTPGTVAGYCTVLRRFARFASARGLSAWPVAPPLAEDFLRPLVAAVSRPVHVVSQFCSAVAWLSRLAQVPDSLSGSLFAEFRRGLVFSSTRAPRKPGRAVRLDSVIAALAGDPSSLSSEELRVRLVVSLFVFALARPSDVAGTRRNLVRFEDDGSATLTLPRSKGDRARDGQVLRLRPPTSTDVVNPVALLREWLRRTDDPTLPAARPLFGVPRSLAVALSSERVSKLGTAFGRSHGLPPDFHAGQFRCSAATSLLAAGVSPEQVQRLGRWSSLNLMFKFYDASVFGASVDVLARTRPQLIAL